MFLTLTFEVNAVKLPLFRGRLALWFYTLNLVQLLVLVPA